MPRPAHSVKPAAKTSRRAPGSSPSETIAWQWQRERQDLDLRDFLLAIYFMRLGTLVDRRFDRMCRARYGVSGGDMRVLLALRRSGHPYARRPTDLFRALLVTSGAVTKKVDRLVEAGFADRMPDPVHAGGFLVHLTRRGLKTVDEAVESLATQSALAPATRQLGAGEMETLSRLALGVLSALERA